MSPSRGNLASMGEGMNIRPDMNMGLGSGEANLIEEGVDEARDGQNSIEEL